MTPTRSAWLAAFTWEFVTEQNAVLCRAKNALHKPTSDGHDRARDLWLQKHTQLLSLDEVVDLCRRCHRLGPFCFFNGNTFVAVARAVVARLGLDSEKAFVIRSLAGHIVAGVATDEEVRAFKAFSDSYAG
jgi:hypothetical protein